MYEFNFFVLRVYSQYNLYMDLPCHLASFMEWFSMPCPPLWNGFDAILSHFSKFFAFHQLTNHFQFIIFSFSDLYHAKHLLLVSYLFNALILVTGANCKHKDWLTLIWLQSRADWNTENRIRGSPSWRSWHSVVLSTMRIIICKIL